MRRMSSVFAELDAQIFVAPPPPASSPIFAGTGNPTWLSQPTIPSHALEHIGTVGQFPKEKPHRTWSVNNIVYVANIAWN